MKRRSEKVKDWQCGDWPEVNGRKMGMAKEVK
jgi:hypothetical protein